MTTFSDVKTSFCAYLETISKFPVLSKEQFYELSRKYKNGDMEAKKTLIRHNLKLVVKCAKIYHQSESVMMDLIQEGNEGLIRAIEKFDLEQGNEFSTYANYWIRYKIEFYMYKNKNMISAPVHVMKLTKKINKEIQRLKSVNEQINVAKIAEKFEISKSKVYASLKLIQEEYSLNKTIDENGEIELESIIVSDAMEPEESLYNNDLVNWFASKLYFLDERQKSVIIQSFGLFGKEEKSGAEIAKTLGLTRERVRQISKQAKKIIFKNTSKEEIEMMLS